MLSLCIKYYMRYLICDANYCINVQNRSLYAR